MRAESAARLPPMSQKREKARTQPITVEVSLRCRGSVRGFALIAEGTLALRLKKFAFPAFLICTTAYITGKLHPELAAARNRIAPRFALSAFFFQKRPIGLLEFELLGNRSVCAL